MKPDPSIILLLLLGGALSAACTKGYRLDEAIYNASQIQNQLNPSPTERGGKQGLNYQQYESERKRQP